MRFSRSFSVTAALIIVFASCKKESKKIDTTPIFYFYYGGVNKFNDNLLLFPLADTLTYNMLIYSTFLPAKAVTVTLSVEDSARQSYNAANATNYQAMPAAAFSFETSFTASMESTFDTIPLKLNKQFLSDGDYMLPVVITSISAYKLDTARRVLYLHTSGNQLAGIYASNIFKTLYNGDAGNNNINDTVSFAINKSLVPTSLTQSTLDYAELGSNGWKYMLKYEAGIFTVEANDIILNSVQSGSFKIISSTFNQATSNIYIKSSYKNLSGNERIVEESLTLQ